MRLHRLFASYYGGSADAVAIKVTIPSLDTAGNLTLRKKAGAGTAAAWDVEWDFTAIGLTLIPGTNTTITFVVVTIADAAAVAPTAFLVTAIWEENA
jgi:hypothetical protein